MNTDRARDAILTSIRDHLAKSAIFDALEHSSPSSARPRLPIAPIDPRGSMADVETDPARRFLQQATSVGASCDIVRGGDEAAARVAAVLSSMGADRIALSDAPFMTRLRRALPESLSLLAVDHLSRDDLFACDVGITTAQFGIAETGTLVLESGREKNRLLSLVPPVHIALLAARDIHGSLADVLNRLSQTWTLPDVASHAITFITGPSRTSDIELTLTIGVHGPRTLHIIIVEDRS